MSLLSWHRAGAIASDTRLPGGSPPVPQDAEGLAPLSVHRAFVVHFRTSTDVARGQIAGRVEHVVSGQATHFASLEELLAFMARVLATIRAPPRRKRSR
jgi:hypothetical protein